MSDRRIYGTLGSGQYRYEIDGREVTKAEFYADRVPAVAPDNDPEDTIARFDGLHVSIPPFPGYQSRGPDWGGPAIRTPERKTVEEQYDPADGHAASGATLAVVTFVIGVAVGSVLSSLPL